MIFLDTAPDIVQEQTFVARIVCDVCEQPIATHDNGVVVAPFREDDLPQTDKIAHAHGGKCLKEWKKRSGQPAYREDLRRHLAELVKSFGLSLEELIQYRDENM
ncbi:MAG: hypothetical protein KY476_07835 [Planctomycetes bacterium]|nr:hypothetical protein [Planctomycetota bacterium]